MKPASIITYINEAATMLTIGDTWLASQTAELCGLGPQRDAGELFLLLNDIRLEANESESPHVRHKNINT